MTGQTAQEAWVLEGQDQEPIRQPDQADPNAPAAEGEETPITVDGLARELGWKPREEWKGSTDNWTPAEDYIRATYQKQRRDSERVRTLAANERRANETVLEYQHRLDKLERATNSIMADRERQIRQQVRSEYEAAKRKAAIDGDDAAYDRLLGEQEEAERKVQEHFEKQRPQERDVNREAQEILSDPVRGRFWREHPWVAADEDAYALVYSVAEEAAQLGKTSIEQVRLAKDALREYFPDRFQTRAAPQTNFEADEGEPARDPETGRFVPQRDAAFYPQQQRRPAPQVQAGQRAPAGMRLSPEQQAAASLPPEARRMFEEQKRSGRFSGDIVKFAKIYNNEVTNVLD